MAPAKFEIHFRPVDQDQAHETHLGAVGQAQAVEIRIGNASGSSQKGASETGAREVGFSLLSIGDGVPLVKP